MTMEYKISSGSWSNEKSSSLAQLSDSQYIATWVVSGTASYRHHGLRAQIFNTDGSLEGEEIILLSNYRTLTAYSPKISVLSDGKFVIAWNQWSDDTFAYSIEARLFSADGTMLNELHDVAIGDAHAYLSVTTASTSTGGFLIGWATDTHANYSQYGDIEVRAYNSSGELVPDRSLTIDDVWVANYSPKIESLDSGGFVLSWFGQAAPNNTEKNIYAQILDENWNEIVSKITVNEHTGLLSSSAYSQDIAALSDGSFVIVWAAQTQSGKKVFAQKLDSNGDFDAPALLVSSFEYSIQHMPQISPIVDGGYFVSWHSDEQEGASDSGMQAGIYGRYFDALSTPLTADIHINDTADDIQQHPSVAALANGQTLISWTTYNQDGQSQSIYGKRLDDQENTLLVSDVDMSMGGHQEGTGGSDVIRGETVSVTLHGLDGADFLYGSDSDDSLYGGNGADVISTSGGTDYINAGDGDDAIAFQSNSTWSVSYVAQNVAHSSLVATGQKVELAGLNRFHHYTDGGDGVDTVALTDDSDAIFIDDIFSHVNTSVPSGGTDNAFVSRVQSIDVIIAGGGDDVVDLTTAQYEFVDNMTIFGNAGNDVIWAGSGDDYAYGGLGNDTIFLGAGSDVATGGAGVDVFQYTATCDSNKILDFSLEDGDVIAFYYRPEDTEANENISLTDGLLEWGNVTVDLPATFDSSSYSEIAEQVVFYEII
jgi:Ca2+-binding RTX toxin-like protein